MRTLALALCLCVMAAEANAGANCAHSQSWQCAVGDLVGAPAPVLGSVFRSCWLLAACCSPQGCLRVGGGPDFSSGWLFSPTMSRRLTARLARRAAADDAASICNAAISAYGAAATSGDPEKWRRSSLPTASLCGGGRRLGNSKSDLHHCGAPIDPPWASRQPRERQGAERSPGPLSWPSHAKRIAAGLAATVAALTPESVRLSPYELEIVRPDEPLAACASNAERS